MLAEAAALGLPPEMAAGLVASAPAAEPQAIEIMPENWNAMRLFLGMQTQWRRAGLSGVACGLDYAVLPVVAAALALVLDHDVMTRLQVLEHAALVAMAEAPR